MVSLDKIPSSSSGRRLGTFLRIGAIALILVVGLFGAQPSMTGAIPAPVIKCNLPEDFPIPGGWFFREMRRPELTDICVGYSVVDDAQASMWTEYYRLGGAKVLGYPLSRRYIGPGGYQQQAFEYAVLQWQPEQNRALPAMIFEQFHSASTPEQNFDSDLRFYGIPEPVSPPPGGFADDVAIRQSWLTDPQILSRYLTDPRDGSPWAFQEQAWDFYGLPSSSPDRISYINDSFYPLLSPWVTQRFQRFALRLILADDPILTSNKKGCVATVRSGALARLLQLVPVGSTLEEPRSGPTVLVEVEPEQVVQDTSGLTDPLLVNVRVSAVNYQPGEVIDFLAVPRNKPTDRAPLPWEQDISFSAVANSLGEITVRRQLWTVEYFVYATGQSSGSNALHKINIQQSALDEFPVAVCQSLTSKPSILIAPTPFVPPSGSEPASTTAQPAGATPRPSGTPGSG